MPFSPKNFWLRLISITSEENTVRTSFNIGLLGWIKSLDRQFSYFGPLDNFLLEFFQGKDKMRRMQKSGEKLIV